MILGVDFMNNTQATIDFKSRSVSICDDLVVQPLVYSKLPENVARSTRAVQIPPQSEAILPVRVSKLPQRRKGPWLLEPLPSLPDLHISLARTVVPVTHKSTFCRVLNPTNAAVTLKPHTPLATISPLSSDAVITYKKHTSPQSNITLDLTLQAQELRAQGLEVDATGFNENQRNRLIALLHSNKDLFTSDLHQLPGTDLVTHKIDTGDATPIRQRPFRHSPNARKEIDRQITKLLDADIIEESDSSWCSPVVLVRKKTTRTVCALTCAN